MEISEILKNMMFEKEVALSEPSNDPRTRNAQAMRQREARDSYEEYRKQYHEALKDAVALMPVVGGKARVEEFLDIAEGEGSSVIVEGDRLFQEYAAYFANFIQDGGLFGVGEALTLRNLIYRTARELNKKVIVDTVDEGTYSVKDYTDLVNVIRTVFFKMADMELVKADIEKQIIEEAELIEYDLPILPVLVFGMTKKEVEMLGGEFLGKEIFPINLSKTPPSTDTLIDTYRGIQTKRTKTREEGRKENEQ